MNHNRQEEIQRLHRARIATVLVSLIAVSSVALAIYAFQQKRKAEIQTALAEQRAEEALQLQKNALEQRNIADSSREQALQQSEIASENERTALHQKAIADSESKRAEQSRLEAIEQQQRAEEQRANAEKQRQIAQANAEEALKQKKFAEEQKTIAKNEKQTSGKLKQLADSRTLANESVLLLNENLFDSSRHKALEAYLLNKNNNGPLQNNDIYNALNFNWTKNINHANLAVCPLPVHCIAAMPDDNIFFVADEKGTLYQCTIRGNTLQKIASYATKEEVRALSVSPDGSKLVAIATSGDGILFSVAASGVSVLRNFKFTGMAKAVVFSNNETFIVLSNKGIGKYRSNTEAENFITDAAINAIAVSPSGRFYVASGAEVNIYNGWDDVVKQARRASLKFDSKITSITVDAHEQYLAAGTYNGFVSIVDLKNKNEIWNKALHLSSVNALEFAVADNNFLQLASGGADQTIKLINVTAIVQKNPDEDIIALKGHNKWIYALHYSPDGRWLLSSGEDNRLIAWKTTMKDLYQTLNAQ